LDSARQPGRLFLNLVIRIFELVHIIDIQAEDTPPSALTPRPFLSRSFGARVAASGLRMALGVVTSPALPPRDGVS